MNTCAALSILSGRPKAGPENQTLMALAAYNAGPGNLIPLPQMGGKVGTRSRLTYSIRKRAPPGSSARRRSNMSAISTNTTSPMKDKSVGYHLGVISALAQARGRNSWKDPHGDPQSRAEMDPGVLAICVVISFYSLIADRLPPIPRRPSCRPISSALRPRSQGASSRSTSRTTSRSRRGRPSSASIPSPIGSPSKRRRQSSPPSARRSAPRPRASLPPKPSSQK